MTAKRRTSGNTYLTGTAAVRELARHAPNQRVKLLIQYAADKGSNGEGLIDEEAGAAAALLHTCYWRRCTDLRDEGLIERPADARMRKGSAGTDRMVCEITDAGWAYLRAMGLDPTRQGANA
jgi:hypothetical protein